MKQKLSVLIILICLSFIFMNATINLDNLFNYSNQNTPTYITKDNSPANNQINDKVATLGRVLFYDKTLSVNNTISCASCHDQNIAFTDIFTRSLGFQGGFTVRHSMRLINARYADEKRYFWDERAATLEEQTTEPIKDVTEMGFSGVNGAPDFGDLINILKNKDYYKTLFEFAFGDSEITEERMQKALSQFIRSIESFDSKYDIGRAQVNSSADDFPNFTDQENEGKRLFSTPPNFGGAGCVACHRAPEFDIDPNSLNNGVTTTAGIDILDVTNVRAPTLRDIVNPDGTLNGPLMHDGSKTTLLEVINHYNEIPNNPENTLLDPRLKGLPGSNSNQNLNLTDDQKNALIAFLKTLTGVDVYTNEKWSNPFDIFGNITITGNGLSTKEQIFKKKVLVYPNPVEKELFIKIEIGNYEFQIYDLLGKKVYSKIIKGNDQLNLTGFKKGIYLLKIFDLDNHNTFTKKIIKR